MAGAQKDASHELCLKNCKEGNITGVLEVLAFDTELVRLKTCCGNLTIKGNELHISQLSLEDGGVKLDGIVNSILYTPDRNAADTGKTVLRRLFQ